MRQVIRIIVQESTGSPDEEIASAGEGGAYDELVQTIDRVVDQASAVDPDPSSSGSGLRTRGERA